MNDVNYNDNTRIIIEKENFEKIILNINNKDIEYTFMDLNDYILFLKIISNENNKKLFKKVKDIKDEYRNYDLRFDKDKFYEDLKKSNINRYKAIKYYSDVKYKINTYYKEKQLQDNYKLKQEKININELICELKCKFINIEFKDNIEYDFINRILDEIINENIIDKTQYNKNLCIEFFGTKYEKVSINRKNYQNLKKISIILGSTIGLAGLSFLLIPTIFGISALGPIAGGLFAYLQSIGITLSVIQSISMTGISVMIGTCCISGASIIILPGLIIKDDDINKDKELKNEIEKYFKSRIQKNTFKKEKSSNKNFETNKLHNLLNFADKKYQPSLYDNCQEFVNFINEINDQNLLESEITFKLSKIIEKIIDYLLNISSENKIISNDAYNIYEDFIIYLEKYKWKNGKFISKLNVQELKNDLKNYNFKNEKVYDIENNECDYIIV